MEKTNINIYNNKTPYNLRSNLFVIKRNKKEYIVYAPLQGISFICDNQDADEIRKFILRGTDFTSHDLYQYIQEIGNSSKIIPSRNPSLKKPDKLMFILSQICNLSCTYCFSQESRSKELLNIDKIKNAINYFFSYNKKKRKDFTFIGGGEPFITWELLKRTILYIEEKTRLHKTTNQIRIITNATLLTEEKVAWLAEKNVVVSVSYDILPDIQNKQRPFSIPGKSSFDAVNVGINMLRKYKVPFTFRTTITPTNVYRMLEMARYVIKNYPEIKKIHFEPVTDNAIDNKSFFRDFVKNYFKALTVCQKNGVFLTNSYIASFDFIRNHMCQGEFCLVPDGGILACHRHSSNNDLHYDSFKLGFVTDDKLVIDQVSLKNVEKIRKLRTKKCNRCFAKWHCAGGCTSKHLVYSENNNIIHCNFIRSFLLSYIEYQLKNQLK